MSKRTPLLLKLFQTIGEERKLSNSFYEASTTLIPKTDKDTTRKLQNIMKIDAKILKKY